MITTWLMHRTTSALLFIGTIAILLLAGCGGQTNAAPAPSATTGATSAAAILRPQPNGTANLTWDPTNKELTVNLALVGLAPTSTHPISISAGTCAAPGAAVHQLPPIKADKYGDARAVETVMDVADGIPAKGWYLEVHNGPTIGPADEAKDIACSNITNPGALPTVKQTVQVPITGASTIPGGPPPTGNAQLTIVNHALTVRLTLRGLAPNSMHAAHIHSGSCAMQGPVVYALTMVKADATGTATVTTTINNVSSIPSSGWYIHVHNGTDLSTQTGYSPLACGDVVTS